MLMTKRSLVAMAGAAALAWAGSVAAAESHADLVFVNGKVITVDPDATIASAVAVKGNRIVAVGDISAWRGPQTQVVDLKGRPLLPGFIDAHSHVEGMAGVEAHHIKVQAPPLKDGKAIIAELKKAQARLPAGAWLVGQGTYNQVMPTRAELDKAFPDNPVRLIWSAHDSLINHKAAEVMGMTRDFPDPAPGHSGHYERLPNGEVFIVRDAPAPWPAQAKFTYPELKDALRGVLDDFYLKKGVTTVSDMSSPLAYRALQDLRKEGRLPTRVRMNYFARDPKLLDVLEASGVVTGLGDDWLRIGGLKLAVDGVWGTTAAVYKPFWKGSGTTWLPNNTGGTAYEQDALDRIVLRAHQAGWQVLSHANGDRAQDMVLNALEAAQQAAPRRDTRHRIEHFGHFLVQDPERTEARLQRMARAGVIASPQVAFLWRLTDVNVREPDVKFFPMKTLIERGLYPAGGVDTIGTQNFATYPMFSIARAVNRDTKYGTVTQPEEAISVMDGIRMFTIWSAQANFLEKDFGSIEVGKVADLVVLAEDPLTASKARLADIPVDMTILDGKVAYAR
ncbi:amidohydrolase [Phenylobacterium sp.]|uniref:amidohydrolase n=1 Tax=Phenylobacterium sp. TaxID=1871053 RepID=UPI002FE41EF1